MVADECKLYLEATTKKVWSIKGEPPVLKLDRKQESVSFYGALNVKEGQVHLWQTDWQDSLHTVSFLQRLVEAYPEKRILIIWDGGRHHYGAVKAWLVGRQDMELMAFPPYYPELNPQEKVWKAGRQGVSHNHTETSLSKLAYRFQRYLEEKDFGTLGNNFLRKYTEIK